MLKIFYRFVSKVLKCQERLLAIIVQAVTVICENACIMYRQSLLYAKTPALFVKSYSNSIIRMNKTGRSHSRMKSYLKKKSKSTHTNVTDKSWHSQELDVSSIMV